MDIKKVLEETGLHPTELAKKIGVNELQVYTWISGKYNMCRTSRLALEIYLAGGVIDKEYTRKDWLKYRKYRTAKQAAAEIGLGVGSINRLSHVDHYNKRMQIILSNRAII